MVTYMNDTLSLRPLREPTFFILLSLSPGPKHGYAILKEVEILSQGRVRLSTGTLYGAIKRLLDRGWIRRVDDPIPNDTDRERKSYDLTELGQRVLNAEIARLQKLVSVAQIQTTQHDKSSTQSNVAPGN
jgi:DNA-binding PadR family transcriptional regulator